MNNKGWQSTAIFLSGFLFSTNSEVTASRILATSCDFMDGHFPDFSWRIHRIALSSPGSIRSKEALDFLQPRSRHVSITVMIGRQSLRQQGWLFSPDKPEPFIWMSSTQGCGGDPHNHGKTSGNHHGISIPNVLHRKTLNLPYIYPTTTPCVFSLNAIFSVCYMYLVCTVQYFHTK